MQEKQSMNVGACPVTACHETTVCVPVSISPFAESGSISIECCGSTVIHGGCDSCRGTVNGIHEFTVSQRMKLNIPIAFGADVIIGETYVQDEETSGFIDGDCCACNCSEEQC